MNHENDYTSEQPSHDAQLTTTSILSMLETTKEQREGFALDIVQRLQNGDADPLKVHLQVKCMEDIIDRIKESPEYKRLLLEEAEKHGKKFEMHNAAYMVKEAGTKYDYSNTGDADLLQQMEVHEAMGKAIKDRQKFLQTVPAKGLIVTNEATGETTTIYPPAKTSTTIVQVTLK